MRVPPPPSANEAVFKRPRSAFVRSFSGPQRSSIMNYPVQKSWVASMYGDYNISFFKSLLVSLHQTLLCCGIQCPGACFWFFFFPLITAINSRVKNQMIIKQTSVPVFLTPPHPMFLCMCTLTGRTIVSGRRSSPILSSFDVGGKEVIDQHTLEDYQTSRRI